MLSLFSGAGKMGTLVRVAFRTANNGLSCRFQAPYLVKSLSTNAIFDHAGVDDSNSNSVERSDEFEQRIFGGISGSDSSNDSFFQQLDRLEKVRGKVGLRQNERIGSGMLDGLDEGFNTLSDGMDGKLKKAATNFEFDREEVGKDNYSFAPDMNFINRSTNDIEDLDPRKLRGTKPPKWNQFEVTTKEALRKGDFRDLDPRKLRGTKPPKWNQFEVTTKEALRKADFRNVRFLANFITEAGIIVKRSKTGISAKAQRKIAREIKTARAFGLMPFTTMGTKSFVFGKTMEDLDKDYQYKAFDRRVVVDDPNKV